MCTHKNAIYFSYIFVFLAFAVPQLTLSAEPLEIAIERFPYKHISDVPILANGMQEFDYHLWLEDWHYKNWDYTVLRNELTYRMGLKDRLEVGADLMHTRVSYSYQGQHWGTIDGLNDVELYAKYLLLRAERKTNRPVDICIGGKLFAPTGDEGEGFGVGDWYTGEFIAFSKSYDPWIFHLDIGRVNIDKTGWKSHNYWGIGGMYFHQQKDMEYGLSIEVCGCEKTHPDSGERLKAIIGLSGHPQGSNAVSQIGFLIPMDGSGQRWGLLLSVSFLF